MRRRDLRARLQRAHGVDKAADPAVERGEASADQPGQRGIRAALKRQQSREERNGPYRFGRARGRAAAREPVELPEGQVMENERGACFVRRLSYPLSTSHGAMTLGAAVGFDHGVLSERAQMDCSELSLQDCLFFDTETTGLMGGAGNTVFLTGVGWFETDDHGQACGFVLEQLFLRCFSEEPAMWTHLAGILANHPVPVSFVGKTFDRHRIAARLAVNKVQAPILTDRHLDLYYLARRRFGKELPNVRLRTVEEQRLGFFRDDDLPGSEAPQAFLDWLRDGTGPVDRVLEHNRLDVLSLVTLFALLGH